MSLVAAKGSCNSHNENVRGAVCSLQDCSLRVYSLPCKTAFLLLDIYLFDDRALSLSQQQSGTSSFQCFYMTLFCNLVPFPALRALLLKSVFLQSFMKKHYETALLWKAGGILASPVRGSSTIS